MSPAPLTVLLRAAKLAEQAIYDEAGPDGEIPESLLLAWHALRAAIDNTEDYVDTLPAVTLPEEFSKEN